jgi:hypothetical protein
MAYVGYTGVSNQANTTDGFALGVGACNDPAETTFGENVGDGGVVDLYHNNGPATKSYILMESSGYVLQQDSFKIVLEAS